MARKPRSYKLSRVRKGSRKSLTKAEREKLKQEKNNDELWLELAKETVRMSCMHMDLLDE